MQSFDLTRTRARRLFLVRCCLAFFLWFAADAAVDAANWPAFRGPNADGIAAAEKPPVHFGPASNLLWRVDVPPGLSSPVIWGGLLFLTATEGTNLTTLCLDRLTGKTQWKQSVPVRVLEKVHAVNSPASPTPVTDGKAVYVYFGSFGLLAYDFAGRELWRKPLPMPRTSRNQGTGTSPILAEGKLLLFVQIGADSHLLAVNPADGREMWSAPMPVFNDTYATPVVWKENGKGLVGMVCASCFTAFSLDDGKDAWWITGLGYQACCTPITTSNGLVISVAGLQGEPANTTPPPPFDEVLAKYDTHHDGLLHCQDIPNTLLVTDRHTSGGQGDMSLRQALGFFGGIKSTDTLDRPKYESIRKVIIDFQSGEFNQTAVSLVRTGGTSNATPTQVAWRETKCVPEIPSPLLWQGRLYFIRNGGLLACRDLQSGKLIYDNRLDAPGGYFASPVLADGRLYVASDRGTVTVVQAGETFAVLAHNELDDTITASPAVVDNKLYIRSASKLWAFGANP